MSYHNGSVWPHDNALIALGLARYGLARRRRCASSPGLIEAAAALRPAAAAGAVLRLRAARRARGPTAYPVACSPQAWAAAAPFGLLGACLGLSFDPAARQVRLERPVLPAGLDRVVLRGLSLGGARIDIQLQRADGGVAIERPGRRGEIGAVMLA